MQVIYTFFRSGGTHKDQVHASGVVKYRSDVRNYVIRLHAKNVLVQNDHEATTHSTSRYTYTFRSA